MKIPAIQQTCYRQNYSRRNGVTTPQNLECKNLELSNSFYYPQGISFGLDGAPAMKKLFSYGLPCIYTGIEMIDSQVISKLLKNYIHRLPAIDVCRYIDPLANSLMEKEKEVYAAIKEQAIIEPHKNIKEIMQSLRSQYEYELIKKQMPLFKALESMSYCLPDDLRFQLIQLLTETENKINKTPIVTRFSVTELNYKLKKIKEDIAKLHDKKALGIVNHMIKMSSEFEPKTNEKNIFCQRKKLANIERYLNNSILRGNEALQELMETSKAKINAEKISIPFSRKAFIYDLSQIIKELDDSDLKETFMKIAQKLPTSQDSTAAYITKYSKESSDKILYRLLWPSMATIEHLLPKSCGGKNELANYGGACARLNSDRSSRDFKEWITKHPEALVYCQKYVDRLIKYARAGIFEKEQIDIQYIEDFKKTIDTLSDGAIVLDTSKLYKGGRFKKPESAQTETIS